MSKKNISQEKIIQSFLSCAYEKSAGATSLADIADSLEIKKASLYNHFENRDAMYKASMEYCKDILKKMPFFPISKQSDEEGLSFEGLSVNQMFKLLVTRFFELYENDSLFKIYSFVHTEQFFNRSAFKIVQDKNSQIIKDVKKVFETFYKNLLPEEQREEYVLPEEKRDDINTISKVIGSIIIQQLDAYLISKKEIIRQNPDSGIGSLFALPVDKSGLDSALALINNCLAVFKY